MVGIGVSVKVWFLVCLVFLGCERWDIFKEWNVIMGDKGGTSVGNWLM